MDTVDTQAQQVLMNLIGQECPETLLPFGHINFKPLKFLRLVNANCMSQEQVDSMTSGFQPMSPEYLISLVHLHHLLHCFWNQMWTPQIVGITIVNKKIRIFPRKELNKEEYLSALTEEVKSFVEFMDDPRQHRISYSEEPGLIFDFVFGMYPISFDSLKNSSGAIFISGDGTRKRSYIYLGDLVLLIQCMKKKFVPKMLTCVTEVLTDEQFIQYVFENQTKHFAVPITYLSNEPMISVVLTDVDIEQHFGFKTEITLKKFLRV